MNLVKTYCDKQKCSHIYTCAKTGYGVDETFENLNTKILKKVNSAEKMMVYLKYLKVMKMIIM